jgi:Bacterial Ig-like domain (group 2)/Kelch motif
MKFLRLLTAVFFSILMAGCSDGRDESKGGNGETPSEAYKATTSVAQKGPLQIGSLITTQELDGKLIATGKSYSYTVTSDFGTFTPTATYTSRYVEIYANGYYFDEVTNAVSGGSILLSGLVDLSTDTLMNVNLLTTLAYKRIKTLVSNGVSFEAARVQAEREVLAALKIPSGSSYGAFNTFDLSKGREVDQILAVVSAMFVSGRASGNVSELIGNFQADLAVNGKITIAEIQDALTGSAQELNLASVAMNLNSKVGSNFTSGELGQWVDHEGDGVVGKFEYQVNDAGQSSTFTLPAYTVDKLSGLAISVSAGQMTVNGTAASGAVMLKRGDAVVVGPTGGNFPNGNLNIYLKSETKNLASVSFVRGMTSVSVSPAALNVAKGITSQFVATASYTDGSKADISASVTWSIGNSNVGSITSTGSVSAIELGATSVVATYGSLNGSTSYTVTGPVIQNLEIYSVAPYTGVGRTESMMAIAAYSDGRKVDATNSVVWESSSPAVATINATTGQAVGVSLGVTTITATLESVARSVTLTVSSNPWSYTSNVIFPPPLNGFTATALNNGSVLLVNKSGGNGQIYDPLHNIWQGGVRSAVIDSNTATLLGDGRVLLAGLNGLSKIYNVNENTWSVAGAAPGLNLFSSTLLLSGKVLIAGGSAASGAHLYDPATNQWEQTDTLASGRGQHTATLLKDGRVLVVGGVQKIYSFMLTTVASAEFYDPVRETWSLTGSMNTARKRHTVTLLADGKVLATGGFTASAEIYDPATGDWAVTGSMSTDRTDHTATLLNDGKVLVIGGYIDNYSKVSDTVEIYDPANGTWSAVGGLQTARAGHEAVLLTNGKVLVVGGADVNDKPINNAELSWSW